MGRAKRERAKASLATSQENRDMIRLVPVAVGVHRAVREMQQRPRRRRATQLRCDQGNMVTGDVLTHTEAVAASGAGGGQ